MTNGEMNGLRKYLVGVGIAVTLTLLIQSGTLIYWCGGMEARVKYIERDVANNTMAIGAALKAVVKQCVPDAISP